MEPVISIYCPSVRTHFWMMQYYSLIKNDIPFEIIYIGPKVPDFAMPAGNIRYIQSDATLAEASHIAIKESRAEYILHSVDDAIYSEGALDKLKDYADKRSTDYYASATSYIYRIIDPKTGSLKSLNDRWTSREHSVYFDHEYARSDKPFKPVIPYMGGMTLKSTYFKMGGFDKRLKYRHFEVDYVLRIHEAGGQVDFCEDVIAEELKFGKREKGTILTVDNEENTLFFSLWCKDDDKAERYTPYNVKFANKDEFWQASYGRNKVKKLTVLPTRSDKLHPIEDM